jgi:hypothetical protein
MLRLKLLSACIAVDHGDLDEGVDVMRSNPFRLGQLAPHGLARQVRIE